MGISYHYDLKTQVTTSVIRNCENDFLRCITKLVNKESRFFSIREPDKKVNNNHQEIVHKKKGPKNLSLKMNKVYLSHIKPQNGEPDDIDLSLKYSKDKTLKNYYKAFDARVIAVLRDIVNMEHAVRKLAERCHVELPEDLQ